MADEFANFELVKPAQADEYAGFEPVNEAVADAEQLPSQQPQFAAERERLSKFGFADDDPIYSLLDRIEKIGRPAARGVVDLADGVLSLPKLAAAVPVAGLNALGANIRSPLTYSLKELGSDGGKYLSPRNDTEQLASSITRGLGGVLGGFGIGGALGATGGLASTTANVGRTLLANPALQTVGAVTGAASADVARKAGAGPAVQTLAGLAGGIAPSLATSGAAAATRGVFRGGEAGRQQVAQNVATFERAGTTPSVGQATGSRVNRAAESLLSRLPGGAGKVINKAETQADELAKRIETNAGRLAGKTSAETTGRKISSAIEGSFVPKFRAQQKSLYTALDNLIPPDSAVGVSNTQNALKELTKVSPGAAATTARLVNPKIKQIADDLAVDAQTGSVPYSALKDLRTRIGEQLESGLVSDVPAKQWKRLYGALSEDMRAAASQAGPQAERAFGRANNYTKAGMARLELLDGVIQKAGGPEAVFKAATAGTTEGASRLRAVMRSLDEDGQKAVSATVLRRLGRAVNSQQDELGEKFSTETFLTNFNKLSSEAKSTLFDRFGPQYSRDIEALSKVAANLRDGSKVFKNPSGTGQATVQQSTVATFALSVLTGRLDVAAGIAGGVVASNLSARLMTNAKFVRWVAVSTKVPKSALSSQINGLAQMAQRNKDPELFEAVELLKDPGNDEPDGKPQKSKNSPGGNDE